MVTIVQAPVTSRIVEALPQQVLADIDLECSFMYPGSEFIPSIHGAMWDGTRHLFSVKTQSFPTGLTPRIVNILKKYNLQSVVIPPQITPQKIHVNDINIELRDYQKEALEAIASNTMGLIRAPTGSGKSEIICGTIVAKKVPTLILVHRKELLYQMHDRLQKRLSMDIGLIGDGHEEYQNISVAMIQTLMHAFNIFKTKSKNKSDKMIEDDRTVVHHKKKLLEYQMLISDEVHVIGALVFYKVSKLFTHTLYRYGFSATPLLREDSPLLVEGAFGPIIFSRTIADLRGKYLADVNVYFIQFIHKPVPRTLKYAELYKQEVINNQKRNTMICDIVNKCGDKKILIAVRNIEHGKVLESMIPNSKFVYGAMSGEKRSELLHQFEQGELKRIICTSIWEQGVDIPSLEVLIDVRAEKSAIAFVQLVGRVMRKTPLKQRATVVDIFDTGCRWLSAHSYERMDIATKEIGEVNYVSSFY